MTIFEELRRDHDRQRELLNSLVRTEGESDQRQHEYKALKEQLQIHALAEERYFYAPLMESDKTVSMSRHGIAEHHAIDKLIEELDNTEMSSPAWLHWMKKLQHKVEHHLEDEEHSFFQLAGKVLDDKEKNSLASDYKEEMAKQLS